MAKNKTAQKPSEDKANDKANSEVLGQPNPDTKPSDGTIGNEKGQPSADNVG